MNINFKNFNANIESVLGKSINIEMKTRLFLEYNYFNFDQAPLIENYLFDKRKLNGECQKMYDKCLEIGVKDSYLEEEQRFVNNFFGMSVSVNLLAPIISSKLKAKMGSVITSDPKSPKSVLVYEDYAFGFEDVVKLFGMRTELGMDSKMFTISITPLTVEEIRKFISFLKKYSLETFELILCKANYGDTNTKNFNAKKNEEESNKYEK